MSQPPLTQKSRWSSLWGVPRANTSDESQKALEEMRARHAAEDAKRAERNTGPLRVDHEGRAASVVDEDEDADGNPLKPPEFVVRVAGYGGIIVQRSDNATGALLTLLELFQSNLPSWDSTLTRFGVLVAKLDADPKIAFYVRRVTDGLTLAIPDATSRKGALLQLVMVSLELQAKHRAAFERAGITAYRNG